MNANATENDAPETHDVPVYRLPALDTKLEKFARRAEKLGMTPITYEIVGEKSVRISRDGYSTGRVMRIAVIKLIGSAPVLDGYTFVARTEHTLAGNILAKAPGCEHFVIPTELRDGGAYCDHCKTARNRTDTFIIKTPEGSLMRVGRNCLADFIRSEDAATAIALWAIIADIRRPISDEEYEPSASPDMSLPVFVAAAFRAVSLNGWVSRKEEQEGEKSSTANDASFACSDPPRNPKMYAQWQEAQPTEADYASAKEALEWARSLQGASDYEHNLKTVCSLNYVTPRNIGIAASVVVAYQRDVQRKLAEARDLRADSVYFGEAGKRYLRKLTVTKLSTFSNAFGVVFLYTFEDEAGNQFKWFSSGGSSAPVQPTRDLAVGDTFVFSFTVKNHEEYKGTKGTVIQRASAAESVEAHKAKWLHPVTGEVFGSKKALVAATA